MDSHPDSSLVPRPFLYAEGNDSLVNRMFRFGSLRQIVGGAIRLLHENDVVQEIDADRES